MEKQDKTYKERMETVLAQTLKQSEDRQETFKYIKDLQD